MERGTKGKSSLRSYPQKGPEPSWLRAFFATACRENPPARGVIPRVRASSSANRGIRSLRLPRLTEARKNASVVFMVWGPPRLRLPFVRALLTASLSRQLRCPKPLIPSPPSVTARTVRSPLLCHTGTPDFDLCLPSGTPVTLHGALRKEARMLTRKGNNILG